MSDPAPLFYRNRGRDRYGSLGVRWDGCGNVVVILSAAKDLESIEEK